MPIAVCRWCRAEISEVVLDLGRQPAADDFPLAGAAHTPRYPLQMAQCPRCALAQLVEDPTVAEEPLGVEPQAMRDQAEQAVNDVRAAGLLSAGMRVAEFDSPHGGSWRDLLVRAGAVDVTDSHDAADIVVDVFSLMHDADQRAALTQRVARLRRGGTVLILFHPLSTIVSLGQWNALRHGHMAYYSVTALVAMLDELGLGAVTCWHYGLYGGSVLLAARAGARPDEAVRALLAEDAAMGVSNFDFASVLQEEMSVSAGELRRWLAQAAADGLRVAGYAAASRAVPLLNAADIGPQLLPMIADGAPGKAGRSIPGVSIPVVSVADLLAWRPDRVLLFVPDLLDEVRARLPEVESSGGRWVVAEPRPYEVPAG